MPIIPMKQVINLYKKDVSDGWGKGKFQTTPSAILKCRFQEGLDREEMLRGDRTDMVLNGKFYFDKYPDITLEDNIEFIDEHQRSHRFQPRNIDVIRGLNGRPLMTVVLV
jgi:hypothetical protein